MCRSKTLWLLFYLRLILPCTSGFLKEEKCSAKFSRKCQSRSVESSSACSLCGSRQCVFIFQQQIQLLKKEHHSSAFLIPFSVRLFLSISVIFFILFFQFGLSSLLLAPHLQDPARTLVLSLPSFLVCAERCFCCCRSHPQDMSD